MAGFLSDNARQPKTNTRATYTLDEDQVIVDGLEAEQSAKEIAEKLERRSTASVRNRIRFLRSVSDDYPSLAEMHAELEANRASKVTVEGEEGQKEDVEDNGDEGEDDEE